MHTVKIENQEYSYPSSIDELTLGEWEEIQTYVKNRITDKYTYDDVISILELITGISKKTFLESPAQVFNIVFETVKWIFEVNFEGIKPKDELEIDGKIYTYGKSENITLREWVDIDTILSKFPDDKKFSGVMAVRIRENGAEYSEKESEQIEDRISFWKGQKVVDVMPIINFFLLKEKMLLTNFQSYSMAVQIAQVQMERINNSLKNGDGSIRLSNWRKMILKKLTPYLQNQLSECYRTWHTLRIKIMQHHNQELNTKI